MTREQILARMRQLRGLLDSDQSADLDSIETEIRSLEGSLDELDQRERRQNMAARIASGEISGAQVTNPEQRSADEPQFTRENVFASPEYRSAFARTLMGQRLSDVEQRALGVALTTTATEFVEASATVDGVNNGGLFIPEGVNIALMEAITLESPIFADVNRTDFRGLLEFPYRVSGKGVAYQKEGVDNKDGEIKWATLKLGASEISVTIRVSWKLEALAVEGFISYITDELIQQVREFVCPELVYGNGTEQLRGVTLDAKKHTYAKSKSALDGIGEALKLMDTKLKMGAKIYVSPSIVEEISFAKDSTGNYIFTPINGVGVNSIATYKVMVDPYLKDGDFVIGNLKRFYRLNVNEGLSVTKDVSGKKRANDYTAYTILGGAGQPETLMYGTQAS